MNCKDCIHDKVCDHNVRGFENCGSLKTKFQMIELPIKVTSELKAELEKYCYERCVDEP